MLLPRTPPMHAEEIALTKLARAKAKGRDAIYHGTRFPRALFAENVLRCSDSGDDAVCLTRSPDVAAYFALMQRAWGVPREDEGRGALLILDRRKLSARYRLEPNHDITLDMPRDEMEERIWGRDIHDLSRYLIAVIWEPREWTKIRRWFPLDSAA